MSPARRPAPDTDKHAGRKGTFRGAVLRGMAVVMPPLLTVVLFIWAWNAIDNYLLGPVESAVRSSLVLGMREIYDAPPETATLVDPDDPRQGFHLGGVLFVRGPNDKYLPKYVVDYVDQHLDRLGPLQPAPASATAYWHLYVELHYLPRVVVVPIFLLVFIALMYFLGKLFAMGMGRMVVNAMESFIGRVPLVSNVYGSVKQVTDFVFSDREIEFNRVVAVEYPRKGIWSIGFVTGQSMADISAAANEPVLSVLMPTSPMPVTGFTITVRKSEALDLNLTIDQAIQFIVSCGVVVPIAQQQPPDARLQLNLPERVGSGSDPHGS